MPYCETKPQTSALHRRVEMHCRYGDDLNTGSVNVGVTATFYETMQGGKADSGLPADTSAAAGAASASGY